MKNNTRWICHARHKTDYLITYCDVIKFKYKQLVLHSAENVIECLDDRNIYSGCLSNAADHLIIRLAAFIPIISDAARRRRVFAAVRALKHGAENRTLPVSALRKRTGRAQLSINDRLMTRSDFRREAYAWGEMASLNWAQNHAAMSEVYFGPT